LRLFETFPSNDVSLALSLLPTNQQQEKEEKEEEEKIENQSNHSSSHSHHIGSQLFLRQGLLLHSSNI